MASERLQRQIDRLLDEAEEAMTGAMQHQQRMYFWITPIQVVVFNPGRFYVPAFWVVHSSH